MAREGLEHCKPCHAGERDLLVVGGAFLGVIDQNKGVSIVRFEFTILGDEWGLLLVDFLDCDGWVALQSFRFENIAKHSLTADGCQSNLG